MQNPGNEEGSERRKGSPKENWWKMVLTGVVGVGMCGWGAWYYYGKRTLNPSGGSYFFQEKLLEVPYFAQGGEPWGKDLLGETPATLAQEGCAVASAAMVLASYGIDTDPGKLNRQVQEVGGYTEQGWLYWEAAVTGEAGYKAKFVYEALPSYHLIDSNLRAGNPVIVRLRYPNGITHFVVITGKRGFDYLIQDPGTKGKERGIYPLKEFGSPIEALRFYSPGNHRYTTTDTITE